jgi:hypothetical protein
VHPLAETGCRTTINSMDEERDGIYVTPADPSWDAGQEGFRLTWVVRPWRESSGTVHHVHVTTANARIGRVRSW